MKYKKLETPIVHQRTSNAECAGRDAEKIRYKLIYGFFKEKFKLKKELFVLKKVNSDNNLA